MPSYDVEIPGQGTFRVDSPTPLSDYQAYQHVLAQMPTPTPEAKPESGILAGLKKGFLSPLSSVRTGIESLLPEENAPENAALKGLQRQEELSKKYESTANLDKVKEAYEKSGLLSAAGEAISQVPGAIAEQAPQLAGMYGMARAGRAVGGTYGALIGAGAGLLAQFYGTNIERQAQEQLKSGDPVQIDRANAALAAVPQTALDMVETRLLFGSKLISGALGIPEKSLVKMSANSVEKLANEKLIPTLIKGTAKGAAAEIPTEIGQQILERAQAGLSITSPDALAEYGDTAYQVGLLGPLGAVGRLSEKAQARGELAGRQAADAAILADQQKQAQAQTQTQTAAPAVPPVMAPITPAPAPTAQQDLFTQEQVPTQLAPDVLQGATEKGKPITAPAPQAQDRAQAELQRNIDALTQQGTPEALAQAEQLKTQLPQTPETRATDLGNEMMTLERKYQALETIRDNTKKLDEKAVLTNQMNQIRDRQQEILQEGKKLQKEGVSFEAPPEQMGLNLENVVTEDDFKTMGIGRTNKNLREAILGKSLADPKERQFVIDALNAYAEDKNRSADISERVGKFVDEIEKGAVSGPISEAGARASQPSIPVLGGQFEPATGTTAPTTTGLASTEPATGGPATGEGTTGTTGQATLAFRAPETVDEVIADGIKRLAAAMERHGVKSHENWMGGPMRTYNAMVKIEDGIQERLKALGVEKPSETVFNKVWPKAREIVAQKEKGVYRQAGEKSTGLSISEVQGLVNRIVEKWKNSPIIQVVQSVNQLPQAIQTQIERENVQRPQGVWDEDTQAVYLIADNLPDGKQVGLTVAHEALGHYGLRSILGENYAKVMDSAYNNAEVKRRADNKIDRGMDKATAVEEVLAEMAEKGEQPSLLNRIVNIIRSALRAIGIDLKGVPNSEVLQLLADSRQYVIEGKGEAGKGGMKVGKVFSGDAPVFYSRLAAMTQHAPKNLREGASGKQWADWINSNAGKFGVKKEEVEWSGIDDLLALMEKSIKFTSKDVNDMLKEEGVKVEEVMYGGGENRDEVKQLRKEENRLNNLAFDLAEEMLDKNVFKQGTWYHNQASGYAVDKAKPGVQLGDYLENIHVPILQGTFDSSAFKPELADEYTAKLAPIQQGLSSLIAEQDRVYGKTTRFDPYKTHGGKNYTEIVLTLPKDIAEGVYNHPHWPDTTNPIAHTRFSEFTDADGKRVLLVDEVQSDWGQEGAKKGFGTTEEHHQKYNELLRKQNDAFAAYNAAVHQAIKDGRMETVFDMLPPDIRALREVASEAQGELNSLTVPITPSPFVQDTKVWAALVVKRLLRYAADNGISRIAFIDGQTAYERFPIDKEGKSTEKGMKTFYDQILPSVVKDVLRKLGADSKPVRSDIEIPSPETRIYFLQKDGEDIAGPFDSVDELTQARIQLEKQGIYSVARFETASNYKSFPAYDLAPETAEKVKEGQAMFRAATPEGAQAEQDMAAFGGRPEQKQKSFVEKNRDSFQKIADDWRASAEKNDSKVAATFGKFQNIASFDQAFNNRLYNHFMGLKNQGIMTLDEAKQALLRVSTSQALHRTNLANQIIDRGNYLYDEDSNRWYAVDDDVNMGKFEDVIRGVADKLGVEPTRARQIVGAAYEANRLSSMYHSLRTTEAELAQAEKDLLKLRDVKQRNTKKELIKALEEKVKELEGKVRHKTPEQVEAGMRLYNSIPEIKDGTEVWNTMRGRVVKMLVDTGVKTQEQAEAWLDEAAYVPFFRDIEEEKAVGPNVMSGGLREAMGDKQMRGSMKEVHDPIDNMYKWMQWSIARAVSNKQLNVMLDQYKAALPDEVKEGKGPDSNTFTVYQDGKLRFYNVADPAIAQAFVGLEPIIFPGISWLTTSSNFLRHAVTRNPLFSAGQLFMDSYTAMFTSGLKSPFGVLREIAKEVMATAQGKSATRTELMKAGILETHDYAALTEADAIGKRLGLEKPGAWAKLASRLDHLAAATDNVIRQGVYNQSIKEGLSHNEAMEKAAELVNFRRVSGDPRVQFLSRIVPFFNAYLQVSSVAVKTLTGRGISPQERDAALKTLTATTAKIAMLSMLYAMAVGDDDDYKKKNRITRDRMWMIPGSGGMGVPVRADIFALPKIIGEYSYQLMANKGYTDSKMVTEALSRAVMGTLAVPSEGIPQFVRPTLGVVTNHDFFQNREIVNATMRKLDVSQQYTKSTSEMAKGFSAILQKMGIEASPLNLDYLIRGYLGTAGTLTALATNDIIASASGKQRPSTSMQDLLASIPNASAFISKEENTAVLSDFYEAARDVNKVVATASHLRPNDPKAMREYMDEHKKEFQFKGMVQAINTQLVNIKREEMRIRESNKSSEQKERELKNIDARRDNLTRQVQDLRKRLYD